ncbi:tyrosine--tRNA ligase [Desulfovibrio sp. 86]|uniref:Tyrosine--tRNA ligase n=1 Tax=uncultured Desulfovibrio sp. TaxID=167968 RepID=A0A212L744_9BACT|nr:tyrosine--tRNA ligase [Desulfovibrio sp. 86]SCM73348.1 Tyrosine--tRNA ligase [uncultured Desulfovibrio sp.]VZH34140.1 Tyrosine--tRNA ligase 2 [Desulfovibrio sp. 86]
MTDIDRQMAIIKRGVAELIDENELRKKIARGAPLRIKVGFDPTAPDLHLGHTVVMHKMRHFQELGHHVVFLIGDFTGRIGDPSGRSETRPPLTEEQVMSNAETYKKQVFKILDPEKTEVAFNSAWLGKMDAAGFIKLASSYTVARMMERDDFEKRFREQRPISIHEFLYPLCQGYDSVALKSDVEMGGTDQKFNLLVGRTLQAHYGIESQCILTMPLLEGTDGVRKMSKSYGNYIGIDEAPSEIFGKVMAVSDELMWRYYELLSAKSLEDIASLKQSVAKGEVHPKAAKEALAHEMVSRYHSPKDADEAQQGFNAVFAGGGVPDDMPEHQCQSGDDSMPPAFLEAAGLVKSRGEAKRLMKEGALAIDGQRCEDALSPLPAGQYVVKLGKKRFLKLIVN